MKLHCQLYTLCLILVFSGCKKFLEEKPDKSLAIPASLKDLQALLDENTTININYNNLTGESSADNFYLTHADWAAQFAESDRETYIWGPEIVFDRFPNEWSRLYINVYRANVVLEGINNIQRTESNAIDYDNIKGSALYIRADAFQVSARNYAKAFDSITAGSDLGIPLRLSSDFNLPSVRSNLFETYNRIITDLKAALYLLPVTPKHVFRPSKTAAYALLSRVYLSMRNYNFAGLYADSALQLYNTLIDYNTLNASAAAPVPQFNSETIYYSHGGLSPISVSRARIDTLLFRSYAPNDLRRTIFFTNTAGVQRFKGQYTGTVSSFFTGIATDELYLTKAESQARAGLISQAMNTLNTLLVKRWKTGTFIPFTAANGQQALDLVLEERRKQLLMRDLRWVDIKRLNKEGRGISIKRFVNNQTYELVPNDPKFALPLPEYVITTSGMQQNPR